MSDNVKNLITFKEISLSNDLLKNKKDKANLYDLEVVMDTETKLVHLNNNVDSKDLFNHEYVYDSSRSITMQVHFEQAAISLQKRLNPKKVLEVGKKGSPQETGLTREEILSVANALGYAMVFVKNKSQMEKRKGSSSTGITHGYHRSGGSRSRENQPIEIVAIQQGYKNPKNPKQNVTELDELWTLAHEVAHGLSQSTNQRGVLNAEGFPFNVYSPDTSRERAAFLGNLEDDLGKVLENLTEGSQGKKISKEIIDLQLNAEFMSMKENALGNTKGTVTPRGYINDVYAYYENGMSKLERGLEETSDPLRQRMIKKQMQFAEAKMDNWVKKNQSYIFAIEELIADAVGGYLMSPQQFKSIAPNTAKFIRDNLNNKPSSKFVKFYSSPLGTILALIMSAFAMDDREEEQLPEGALQLGQGALSA